VLLFLITSKRYIRKEINLPSPKSDAQNECKQSRDLVFAAFFQALHSELKKVSDFFDEAEEVFVIREQRVRNGIREASTAAFTSYNASSKAALSVAWMYKDLLSLETFAIMTYCCFSKLLKMLDSKTGLQLGLKFMHEVVNKANFTQYPRTRNMIQKTHILFKEIKHNLSKEDTCTLQTDESLFIDAVARLRNDELSELRHSGRNFLVKNLIKFDSCTQHTPNKSSQDSLTPLSLRSKVSFWEGHATKETCTLQVTATEYVTYASDAAIRIQF
jgi:hypothetical protein